jgi:hypothetical protein
MCTLLRQLNSRRLTKTELSGGDEREPNWRIHIRFRLVPIGTIQFAK